MRNSIVQRSVLAALLCAAGLGLAGKNIAAQQQAQTTIDAALEMAGRSMGERLRQGTRLAVLNFSSGSGNFSRYTVEELAAILVQMERFTMIDRQSTEAIREEMAIQLSGDVRDDSAQAAGRQLGAEAIITGALVPLANGYRMWLKVIEVETRRIPVYYRCTIRNDANMAHLMESQRTAPAAQQPPPNVPAAQPVQPAAAPAAPAPQTPPAIAATPAAPAAVPLPQTQAAPPAVQQQPVVLPPQTQAAAPAAQPAAPAPQTLPGAVTPPPEDFDIIQNTDGVSITITNYKGSARSIIIPKELYGLPVTDIRAEAFQRKNLTGVVIPDNVTAIKSNAFAGNQLAGVVIPSSVTTIGNEAFRGNLLTSVTIPDSVTTIGSNAFSDNRLTSVTIPDSVTTIGNGAFSSNHLTSIVLGRGLRSTGDGTFSGNYLTSVTIPDSVTTIGDSAFYNNCLFSVTIPGSVTTIGNSAFYNNYLSSVTIPDSVTTIGSSAFYNNYLASVVLGQGLTRIDRWAFRGNQLASVTIARDTSGIGADAGFEQNFINFYASQNRAPGTYSRNGPIWSKTAAPAAAPPAPTAGEYAVGGAGPAGGIIFFDKGLYTDGWRYLEAAPSDIGIWQWGNVYINEGTKLGTGKENTRRIAAVLAEKGESNRAARLCLNLGVNGYRDWFLPSRDELNLMYVFLKTKGLGGFGDGLYWSSSLINGGYSVAVQRFSDGSQYAYTMNSGCSVRAVRAF